MLSYLISPLATSFFYSSLSLLQSNTCGWVSKQGGLFSGQHLRGQFLSFLYSWPKLLLIPLVVWERRLHRIPTSSFENKGLMRYACFSNVSYLIFLTLECDSFLSFSSLNATFLMFFRTKALKFSSFECLMNSSLKVRLYFLRSSSTSCIKSPGVVFFSQYPFYQLFIFSP